MITRGRDVRTARLGLGWSLQELADELRLGRRGASYLHDIEMERDHRVHLSGPMAIAVECILNANGFDIEDGQLTRLK